MGAALLFLATLPQAARLLKTRRADDLAWSFVLLNFVGIALLGLRSLEIRETAFVLLNASTAAFWLLTACVKLAAAKPRRTMGWRGAGKAEGEGSGLPAPGPR